MICELDGNNYCARHKTRHVGGLKDLALDPGPKGQRYRDHWDVQAGLLTQAEWDRRWLNGQIARSAKPRMDIGQIAQKKRY